MHDHVGQRRLLFGMSQRGILRSLLLTALAAGAIGCGDPPIDSNTPEPAGVMEGTVLYVGPPPTCEYDQDTGAPIGVHGRAVILLFEYDNPPPPEGSATTAVNLLVVPGSKLFTDPWNDCPPIDTTPSGVVQRSVGFTWPELPLGQGGPVQYRVQGFYDRDEDFNPFFNITQAPTAGDIAGAAVDDAQAANPQPVPIEFGAAEDFPNGELVGGVTVSLGLPVNTDPPVFYVSTDPLRSEQSTVLTANPIQNEQNILALTHTTLHLYDDLESPRGVDLREALEAAPFDYSLGPNRPEYAWYVRGVDVDGVPGTDPHPILNAPGIAEYQWLTPLVLLQRIQSSVETAAGVPQVLLIPALPNQDTAEATGVAEGDVLFPDLPIGVPPVGVIVTNPAYDVCRIATFGPSSTKEIYDGSAPELRGVLGDCQEIPTGRYAFNVLQGLMAGVPTADAASPTGWNIMGGRFSNQSWTIPNPLGSPEQFVPSGSEAPLGCEPANPGDPDPSPCISDQGVASTFLIHDDVPETYVSRRAGDASCLEGPSTLTGAPASYQFRDFQAGDVTDFVAARDDDAFVTNADVQAVCCEPIAHLCDVPLCGTVEDPFAPGHFIRASPTTTTPIPWGPGETRMRPDCVPFLMPTACCSAPTP